MHEMLVIGVPAVVVALACHPCIGLLVPKAGDVIRSIPTFTQTTRNLNRRSTQGYDDWNSLGP